MCRSPLCRCRCVEGGGEAREVDLHTRDLAVPLLGDAADGDVDLRQAGVDQLQVELLGEEDAVGRDLDVVGDAAVLTVADHLRQLWVQQRLTELEEP